MKTFIQLLVDQTTRTNDLLEKQDKRMLMQQMILQKLEDHLMRIDQRLERIADLQLQMGEILDRDLLSLLDQPLLLKQDVMDKLGISDGSYRNYVKEHKLIPMRLGKIDYFLARDFMKQLLKMKWKK